MTLGGPLPPKEQVGWSLTQARLVAFPRSREGEEGFVESSGVDLQLWERPARAFFVARDASGSLLREVSAGRGYLRDHDHVVQHQVIRESTRLDRNLEIVRSTFGPVSRAGEKFLGADAYPSLQRTAGGLPERIVLDDVEFAWTYDAVEQFDVGGPSITRRRDYTWELYATRELPFLATTVLEVPDMPKHLAGVSFDEGFLYASSWSRSMQAHLIWNTAGREIELVVADTDAASEPTNLKTVASRTGQWRMADLRAPDARTLDLALRLIDLDRIVGVASRMPAVEGSVGRYRLAMRGSST
jgi:hypothetical protein